MKSYGYFTCLLVAVLILSACGSSAAPTSAQTGAAGQSAGTDPTAQANNGQFELPVSLKLALGTLNLDGTSNEVSAEEAAELAPLWKAVRSLGSSDTISTEEMNGLYDQIQESMTTEQMTAIDEMQLTRESMTEISQKLGIELFSNGGGRLGTFTPEMQATAEAARQSGQFPQGGFAPPEGGFPGGGPGGGGGGNGGGFGGGDFQGGGNLTPEQQATLTARRAANGNRFNSGVPTALLDALIQYLEGKAG